MPKPLKKRGVFVQVGIWKGVPIDDNTGAYRNTSQETRLYIGSPTQDVENTLAQVRAKVAELQKEIV